MLDVAAGTSTTPYILDFWIICGLRAELGLLSVTYMRKNAAPGNRGGIVG